MQPIDYLHELLLPELAVAIAALVALVVCGLAWFYYRDYDAVAFIPPSLYFMVAYTLYMVDPALSDDWHRVINRGGLVVLFVIITFQAGKCILLNRSRRKDYESRDQGNT